MHTTTDSRASREQVVSVPEGGAVVTPDKLGGPEVIFVGVSSYAAGVAGTVLYALVMKAPLPRPSADGAGMYGLIIGVTLLIPFAVGGLARLVFDPGKKHKDELDLLSKKHKDEIDSLSKKHKDEIDAATAQLRADNRSLNAEISRSGDKLNRLMTDLDGYGFVVADDGTLHRR